MNTTTSTSYFTKRWAVGRWQVLMAIAFAMTLLHPAHAQQTDVYPTRAVRLVVPVPPGGPADQIARAFGDKLRVELGQAVIIDNRPGAAGSLGTAQVLQAPADGYSLLVSLPSAQITAPLLMEKPPFDGVKDFTPIGRFGHFTAVLLVNETVPVSSFRELLAFVKQQPGKLNYASTGLGSLPHLTTELLKMREGLDMLHIPYRGGAPAVQALVANEAQVMFGEITTALPWIRAKRLKALAVASETRSTLLPDVPTLTEAGMRDAPGNSWIGLAGPPGMSAAVVERLNQALVKASQQKEMVQIFKERGAEPAPSSPNEFKAMWLADQRRWRNVIQTNHIRAE